MFNGSFLKDLWEKKKMLSQFQEGSFYQSLWLQIDVGLILSSAIYEVTSFLVAYIYICTHIYITVDHDLNT